MATVTRYLKQAGKYVSLVPNASNVATNSRANSHKLAGSLAACDGPLAAATVEPTGRAAFDLLAPVASAMTHALLIVPPAYFPMSNPPMPKQLPLPDVRDAAGVLEDSMLMAVPKKKVSASKKRLRNANKKLPFVKEVIRCRICNKIKPPHFYCDKGCAVPGNMGESSE
eukprot:CAMPEP_0118934750 /NCGR_PEP_ID=MMETSP1169-20130426/14069_1 /TAXON_ID=36882 /ORGANISM="Pyramimonas obovata, Strain CCMP722" /LENGTH=168 /DNA_ID=CAMNT_0006877685 /DNA_START=32 /DNA_END=538 /DNA_ORIENTATION=-